MKSLLRCFGGADLLRLTISSRIREARIRGGIVQEELGRLAGLTDPMLVGQLEDGKWPSSGLTVADIFAVSTQVGLSIENLMPIRVSPTPDERAELERERMERGAGVLGVDASGTLLDKDLVLQLFLRFSALEELLGEKPGRCGFAGAIAG